MSTKGITGNEPDPRVIYADIIDHPHWVSPTRKRMSLYNRAAQFSPFDALAGYGDMIAEEERMTDGHLELGEYELGILNRKLNLLSDLIDEGTHPCVTFTVFVPDERKAGGETVTVTEKVRRIDPVNRKIILDRKKGLAGSYEEISLDRIIRIGQEDRTE